MKHQSSPNQTDYFNVKSNQFNPQQIITPQLHQKLEFAHLCKLLALKPPKNILDFGCGTGRITIPLLAKGFSVWAVDLSDNSLTELKSIYLTNKKNSWGQLTLLNHIPQDRQFDAIVGGDILHHINLPQIILLFKKVLKPGGLLVFSEPNPWHLPWYIFICLKLPWQMEKGILQNNLPNLKKQFVKLGARCFYAEGHGLLPTRIFNHWPVFCKLNALKLGNLPLIKYFTFRFIIRVRLH